MAPVTGDSKWSPMLPPPMTGPLGIQQLRPSAFPAAPFGAGASGENVYRPADMNLYSTGRSPLVVPVRAKRFLVGTDQALPAGHPIEHGQLVKVQSGKENEREVDIWVSGYPDEGRQFENAFDLHAASVADSDSGWHLKNGIFPGVALYTTSGYGEGATVDLHIANADNENAVIDTLTISARGKNYQLGDRVYIKATDMTRPPNALHPNARDLHFTIDDTFLTAYGAAATPTYWAIVSETVFVNRDGPTYTSLSVEGTELMKFGDEPFPSLSTARIGKYPGGAGANGNQERNEFIYNAIGVDKDTLKSGAVRFALVTFPFQAKKVKAANYNTGSDPITTYKATFADFKLPTTTTKAEAAEHGIRAVAKAFAQHHGPDVPLGCHLAGSVDGADVGVVVHATDDDCHIACEPESVAAALLESFGNPTTHLAARAQFVKTKQPLPNSIHAETNTPLTVENCTELTPAHLMVHGDQYGKNPNVGIDATAAAAIREVIEHVAQNRISLKGAPQGVLDAVARGVGWGKGVGGGI